MTIEQMNLRVHVLALILACFVSEATAFETPQLDRLQEMFEKVVKSEGPGKGAYYSNFDKYATVFRNAMQLSEDRQALIDEIRSGIDEPLLAKRIAFVCRLAIYVFSSDADRKWLVEILSLRAPYEVIIQLETEYWLCAEKELTDGFIVLCDAYDVSRIGG